MTYKTHNRPPGRFSADDRLRSRSDIARLFQSNENFFEYPFKVIVCLADADTSPLRLLISVPRRKHNKAIDRNRIKRLIRESWRKHKHALRLELINKQKHLHVGLIYTATDILPYHQVEGKIMLILQRLLTQHPSH